MKFKPSGRIYIRPAFVQQFKKKQFNSSLKYSPLAIKAKTLLVFLQKVDAGFQDNQIITWREMNVSHTSIHIHTPRP